MFPYQLVFEAPPWQLWRALPRHAAPPESLEAGRLGRVSLFRPAEPKRGFVFLFSDGTASAPISRRPRSTLAAQGVAVVGVDLPAYLRGLAASDDGCHYLVSEIEELSKRAQRELGFERYHSPMLAGRGAGRDAGLRGAGAVAGGDRRRRRLRRPRAVARTRRCRSARARRRTRRAGGGFPYAPVAALPGALTTCPARRTNPGRAAGRRGLVALAAQRRRGSRGSRSRDCRWSSFPSQQPGPLFAVIYSGDGGWRDLDKTIGEILARHGVSIVGVDSLRYFWRAQDARRGGARPRARSWTSYARALEPRHALLIGYSFGADILPFALNRLPARRARERGAALAARAGLEGGLRVPRERVGSGRPDSEGPAVLPELARIDLAQIQCFYGEEEEDTLCPRPSWRAPR